MFSLFHQITWEGSFFVSPSRLVLLDLGLNRLIYFQSSLLGFFCIFFFQLFTVLWFLLRNRLFYYYYILFVFDFCKFVVEWKLQWIWIAQHFSQIVSSWEHLNLLWKVLPQPLLLLLQIPFLSLLLLLKLLLHLLLPLPPILFPTILTISQPTSPCHTQMVAPHPQPKYFPTG